MIRRPVTGVALAVALAAAAAVPGAPATPPGSVLTFKAVPARGGPSTASDLARAFAAVRTRIAALGLHATVTRSGTSAVAVALDGSEPARAVAAALADPVELAIYDLTPSLLPASIDASRNPVPETSLPALLRRAHAPDSGLPPQSVLVTCSASFAEVCPGLHSTPAAGATYYYLLHRSPQLTVRDVDAAKAAAVADPSTGAPLVTLPLTPSGAARFHAVTRAEARRGRAHGVLQSLAIVVAGELRSFPTIDYLSYPDGIAGARGIQITGLVSLRAARSLAAAVRAGPPVVKLALVRITPR